MIAPYFRGILDRAPQDSVAGFLVRHTEIELWAAPIMKTALKDDADDPSLVRRSGASLTVALVCALAMASVMAIGAWNGKGFATAWISTGVPQTLLGGGCGFICGLLSYYAALLFPAWAMRRPAIPSIGLALIVSWIVFRDWSADGWIGVYRFLLRAILMLVVLGFMGLVIRKAMQRSRE